MLTQSETPYWQNPPTALAMKMRNAKGIRSYGAAYECWFMGVENSLMEVVSSEAYIYMPNVKNTSHLLTGDTTLAVSGPFNVSGHFTQSFAAFLP